MTKKFYVAARIQQVMSAVVEVPDDWTEAEVRAWYESEGAQGEFSVDYEEWVWDWDFCTEAHDSSPANLVIEPRTEEQGS